MGGGKIVFLGREYYSEVGCSFFYKDYYIGNECNFRYRVVYMSYMVLNSD